MRLAITLCLFAIVGPASGCSSTTPDDSPPPPEPKVETTRTADGTVVTRVTLMPPNAAPAK